MKEKSFKEKWQDKKYQAKVKLSGYGVFIFIVILFLVFGQNNTNIEENNSELDNNFNDVHEDEISFGKPSVNNYTYNIKIITEKDNAKEEFYYYGSVVDAYEELIKKVGKEEYNYKFMENKYYILNDNNYILTTKENVYDVLDYNYLDIDNINNYLSYSELVGDEYQVYLKDIILDNDTDDYISFILKKDTINIDYTNLVNYLNDDTYDSYIVNIEYIY